MSKLIAFPIVILIWTCLVTEYLARPQISQVAGQIGELRPNSSGIMEGYNPMGDNTTLPGLSYVPSPPTIPDIPSPSSIGDIPSTPSLPAGPSIPAGPTIPAGPSIPYTRRGERNGSG